jgi:hypothetical protein
MHQQAINTVRTNTSGESSVLASLRALLPDRSLSLDAALLVAERQAERLLRLRGITSAPVPMAIVTGLPRISVDYDPDLPRHAASGCSHWDSRSRCWVIAVNPEEPTTRQRFTILHEYKHIIDHYHPGLGGRLPRTVYGLDPTEYVAEYFAGCVLMPKRWVKSAFYQGVQHLDEQAELFDVSPRAIEVRLSQLGLSEPMSPPAPRRPAYRLQPRPRRNYRPLSLNWLPAPVEEVAA